MSLDLAAVRAGIVTLIKAANTGLEAYPSYRESIAVPSVIVGAIEEIEFHISFNGGSGALTRTQFKIHVLASRVSPEGIDNLDAAVLAVTAAIEADASLSSSVMASIVRRVENFGLATYAGTDWFAADLILDTYAR